MDRANIGEIIMASLHDLLDSMDRVPESGTEPLGEDTVLIGDNSILDSMRLVSLIVDVEQRLEETSGLSLTIADERAMNMSRSPFRTIGTLTDYVHSLVGDEEV